MLKKGIALDLETTGTVPGLDRIVQIGIGKVSVSLEPPEISFITKTKSTLLNPDMDIPKEVSDIHGITNDMVKDSKRFRDVSSGVSALLSTCDLLVGYNLNFDLSILEGEFNRIGSFQEQIKKIRNKPRIDGFRIWQKLAPRRLEDACRQFGIQFDKAHDAGSDVDASVEVANKLIGLLNSEDLSNMVEGNNVESGGFDFVGKRGVIRKRLGRYFMAVGKHAGVSIDSIPDGYLVWMLKKGDFEKEVCEVVDQELSKRQSDR